MCSEYERRSRAVSKLQCLVKPMNQVTGHSYVHVGVATSADIPINANCLNFQTQSWSALNCMGIGSSVVARQVLAVPAELETNKCGSK